MYTKTSWRPICIDSLYYPCHINGTVMRRYSRLSYKDCESLCELMPYVLDLHKVSGAVSQMNIDQLMDLRVELNKVIKEVDRAEAEMEGV